MQKEKVLFQPIDLIIYGIILFLLFAFVERVHLFHYKRLFSPSPYGYIIGREGKVPSQKEEKLVFKKKFPFNQRLELRIWFWGKDEGVLKLNGNVLFDWEKPDLYFLRITKEKLKQINEFEVEIKSKDGFSAFWLSDISGLGTGKDWECFIDGKKVKTRIFGKPPYSSLFKNFKK